MPLNHIIIDYLNLSTQSNLLQTKCKRIPMKLFDMKVIPSLESDDSDATWYRHHNTVIASATSHTTS